MNLALATKLGNVFGKAIGTLPLANSAGTRNGTGVDRATPGGTLYMGCTLSALLGAETGTPTSFTADFKLQDSADNSTFADYVPPGGVAADAAVTQMTAGSAISDVDIDLSGARRYIRVVETIAITGGTSPKVPASSTLLLYGADRTPV